MTQLVKIHDPKKPGDFLLINPANFDSSKHKLFSEPLETPKEEAPKTPAKRANDAPKSTRPQSRAKK